MPPHESDSGPLGGPFFLASSAAVRVRGVRSGGQRSR